MESQLDTSSNIEGTAQYLWTMAKRLSTACPAASRYYMSNLKINLDVEPKSLKEIKPSQYCKYCGSIWVLGNHKVQIKPIPSPNGHIKKLLQCEEQQPWKLNNRQKKKLKKFKESTNKIIYKCNICKKTTTFPGLKRCPVKKKNINFSTPISKIKLKKGDLNAGLYIKSPAENESRNKLTENTLKNKQEISEKSFKELVDTSYSRISKSSRTSNSTPNTSKQNVTPEATSSVKKKRKKTLLSQILNQEQEAKNQRKSLTSFLISL